MLWQLRPPAASDVSFVFNSWLKSFRDAPAMAGLTNTTYYAEIHRCIEKVVQSPNCRVIVACDPGEGNENVIFGYAVGELCDDTYVIHWVYVKHPFRGFGCGKAMEQELLKASKHTKIEYSCASKLTRALLKSRNYSYNPFKLWSHQ